MFRATMCPSSGGITISMQNLIFVTLDDCVVCRVEWIPPCISDSHPRSDKYKASHRYSYFSWLWARSRPKHVEKEINILRKNMHQFCFIYKKGILPPKRPEWLSSPVNLLFGVFQGYFPTGKAGGVWNWPVTFIVVLWWKMYRLTAPMCLSDRQTENVTFDSA